MNEHASVEPYVFYYWPMLPGRGEFVRLVLEDVGAAYVDAARVPEEKRERIGAVLTALRDPALTAPPFAVPMLRAGDVVIGQTANIALFLATRHGLLPTGEAAQYVANGAMLTIMDIVGEVHDTHHPVGTSAYYEDQKAEALVAAERFRMYRLPRFAAYLDRVAAGGGGPWLLGERASYVDLALFQLLRGLAYAFPEAASEALAPYPRLGAIEAAVAERPRVAAYLGSERCLPFNADGIFRRYPELDGPAGEVA